jgi:WD40 repeat protein
LQELDFIASQTELFSVAFSPNSELLAFGSDDGTIELWNIKQKKLLYTFAAHSDRISEPALGIEACAFGNCLIAP